MSVRKREWTTRKGEQREAWIVDHSANGERHIETFERKKDADAREAEVTVNVDKGIHTPANKSITIAQAADDWLRYVEAEGRERATIRRYRELVAHVVRRMGDEKLGKLTSPRVNAFRDDLLKTMSRPTARKVLITLKAILKEARRRGNVAQNVASDVAITSHGRIKPKLEMGRDIPTRDEIRRIIDAAKPGKARTILLTAALTGMRASELRGLRWADVDLPQRQIHVRQRADRYGTIGQPKSAAGVRTIPIEDMVVNSLREWRLACPKSEGDLVFPTSIGTVEYYQNLVRSMLWPSQEAAGVVDGKGEPKYGMHALRHFYASWCINRRKDGGLELPPKTVQARLGHASIVMTLDICGHLFPSGDDGSWPQPQGLSSRHERDTNAT
jgi:integrase